ncbi:MAG: CYTH domain-containing protein [Magnetococcales bacterium]|nr:CYTH domain-containing protein [Magnetococcales bacterium]
MKYEIERRFLMQNDNWRHLGVAGELFRQGFLSTVRERVVRVRVVGERATLTIKGIAQQQSFTRAEFEYTIPLDDGNYLLEQLCETPLIEKRRYTIPIGALVWEIDEFFGDNQGLILAEVELQQEQQEIGSLPDWVGREITYDARYSNASLVHHPWGRWSPEERNL